MGERPDPFRDLPAGKPLAVAILLTALGGLALLVGYIADLTRWVLMAGLVLWLVGALVVLGLAIRTSRASGSGRPAALGYGSRLARRWIWGLLKSLPPS